MQLQSRRFSFTNSGKMLMLKELLYELATDGLPIVRRTFYNLETNGTIPKATRTNGKWRIFTREEANLRKYLIWKNYYGEKSAEEYKKKFPENVS